ncbi:MAG TPA: hypothetical protein VJA21_34155 [Verrucomicrobiae bacterium]
MKLTTLFVLFVSLFLSPITGRAGTAQVRLYCLSLKFSQSTDQYGDRLELTSTSLRDFGLGELGPPTPVYEPPVPGGDSYLTGILLYDVGTSTTFGGSIGMGLPPMDDLDGNRYPDPFEVSKAVNFPRYGMMSIIGYGTIYPNLTWVRAAGSKNGTCIIQSEDPYWGTFNAPFELLEYTGTLTYTPGASVVSGTINLTKTGDPTKTISGPLSFAKSAADPYNNLTNQPGAWTGPPTYTNTFTTHWFSRDVNWPSNYVGLIEFSDGLDFTYEAYANWVLSITDLNDTDHDGIPDFSDDAQVVQPRAPRLSVARDSSGVQLTIAGDVGHVHAIQETTSLSSPNWQPVESVTLSSDPQTVTLALPAGPKFWRVIAQ